MSLFLIFLLFLLNICSIFAIIILYLRQNRLIVLERKQRETINEMEELMTGYLLEMKEENENFLKVLNVEGSMNHVSQGSKDDESKKERQKNETNFPEPIKRDVVQQDDMPDIPPIDVTDTLELSSSGSERQKKDFSSLLEESMHEPSLNEQVDELAAQGASVAEIAQKLNRGRTEIELLLKFRKKQ